MGEQKREGRDSGAQMPRVPARVREDRGRTASAPERRLGDRSQPNAPVYEPTVKELAVIGAWLAQCGQAHSVPWINVEASTPSSYRTSFDHPDQITAEVMLAHALGVHDLGLARVLRDQLANVARVGKSLTAEEFNGAISIVRSIGPRNPTEALLAAQMAAIHNATMVAARRLNHVENLAQQDSASNMLNKLARTFAAQMEALKRYRSDGQQTIKVQHVNVNDGGQAI